MRRTQAPHNQSRPRASPCVSATPSQPEKLWKGRPHPISQWASPAGGPPEHPGATVVEGDGPALARKPSKAMGCFSVPDPTSEGLRPSEPPDSHPNMASETDPPHREQVLQPLERPQALGKESNGNRKLLPFPAVQKSPGVKRDWPEEEGGEEDRARDRGQAHPPHHRETGPTWVASPFTLGPSAP